MNIALCITGSISAYKMFDLTRTLIKEGHCVRILLSKGSLEFIKAETFHYLGADDVYLPQDDFSFKKSKENAHPVVHIHLTKWADLMVIAPLSANTLSHLAHGKACDLISSVFLAWNPMKPILLFPAMNTKMLAHPFTCENLKKIDSLEYTFVAPTGEGLLACGDEGKGKLLDIQEIKALIETVTMAFLRERKGNKENRESKENKEKMLLITAGATIAPLDSVRYLTNPSTGKTALAFIEKALSHGLRVHVVAGYYATKKLDHYLSHPHFELERVVTTEDMSQAVHREFPQCHYYISAAAIGDIQFPLKEKGRFKFKKESLPESLPTTASPDILKSLLKERKEHQKIVGFAAEVELSDEVLKEKISRKPVDLLVGTKVNSGFLEYSSKRTLEGFACDRCEYRFGDKEAKLSAPLNLSKEEMASYVFKEIFSEK